MAPGKLLVRWTSPGTGSNKTLLEGSGVCRFVPVGVCPPKTTSTIQKRDCWGPRTICRKSKNVQKIAASATRILFMLLRGRQNVIALPRIWLVKSLRRHVLIFTCRKRISRLDCGSYFAFLEDMGSIRLMRVAARTAGLSICACLLMMLWACGGGNQPPASIAPPAGRQDQTAILTKADVDKVV